MEADMHETITCISRPTCCVSCFWVVCVSSVQWWFCHSHGCIVFCCKIRSQVMCLSCGWQTFGMLAVLLLPPARLHFCPGIRVHMCKSHLGAYTFGWGCWVLGMHLLPPLDNAKWFSKVAAPIYAPGSSAGCSWSLHSQSWAHSVRNGSVAKQSWPLALEDALPPFVLRYQHSYFFKWSPRSDFGGSAIRPLSHSQPFSLGSTDFGVSNKRTNWFDFLSHENCTWFDLPTCQRELFLKVSIQFLSLGSLSVFWIINSKGGGKLQDSRACTQQGSGGSGDNVGRQEVLTGGERASPGSNYWHGYVP